MNRRRQINDIATLELSMNKRHGEGQDVAYYRYVSMNKRHGERQAIA